MRMPRGFQWNFAYSQEIWGCCFTQETYANFRQSIDGYGLKDLGFTGAKFTCWRNSSEEIRVHLDRVFANWEWCKMFPHAKVSHLNPSKSDHLPLHLTMDVGMSWRRRRNRFFHFEEAWARHHDYLNVVTKFGENVWEMEHFGKGMVWVKLQLLS